MVEPPEPLGGGVSRPTPVPSLVEFVETSLPECFFGVGVGRRPVFEGLLDLDRRQGRPSGAGFAGRFAVLDSGPDREKIWLAIGAAARVWRSGFMSGTGEVDGMQG